MTRFMTDLILYYACALAAEQCPVADDEAMRCSLAYERAKTHFYTAAPAPEGTPERARQSNAAFRAMRAWEMENPGKVDELTEIAVTWQTGAPA